jgi:hypothetical protein
MIRLSARSQPARLVFLTVMAGAAATEAAPPAGDSQPSTVVPNDNLRPAGTLEHT